jgi:outer membrane lipoprotein carrier protein
VEVALVLVLTTLAAAAPSRDAQDAVALARRIQQRHHDIRDMKARFVQTYASSMLGREVVERGTLALKPPGRMRWEYEQPEKKLFVSNGKSSYFYVPEDKQVITFDATGDRGVAVQLLSGRSDLLTEFQVFAVHGVPNQLRLVPKDKEAEIREAVIEAEASGRIRRLEILDLQGNRSEYRFENVQENVGLSDSLFEFKVPKGVEVVAG